MCKPHFQAISVQTNLFNIIGFYRSPSSDKKSDQMIRKYFDEEAKLDTILVGDLNIPEVNWKEDFKRGMNIKYQIARTMIADFRKQWVDFNTRNNNILDVVISHKDMKIGCYKEENKPEKLDHEWIGVEVEVEGEARRGKRKK